jgi:hypothetical protein
MGKLDRPGYPLPEGELGEDELACTIVYYPDRPEYRQALVSSLLYLGNWLAWERDEDRRGKDAATNWKLANDLSLECLYMGCFEQLQQDVSNILEFLQNKKDCCDDNLTYGPSEDYQTEIEPNVGEAPDFYGETEIDDWDDWSEHVCYNAHQWVDELILQAGNIDVYLNYGGLSVATLGGSIVAISFFVAGGVVSIPFLILAVAGLAVAIGGTLFEEAAEDLEDARKDIVCALLQGTSLADAVEDALSSGAAWDLFYTLIDYDSAQAIIYEGGNDETFLDPTKKDDCVPCDQIGDYRIFDNWSDGTYAPLQKTGLAPDFYSSSGGFFQWNYNETDSRIYYSVLWLRVLAGLDYEAGDTITIHQVKFNYIMLASNAGDFKIGFNDDSGYREFTAVNETTLTEKVITLSPARVSTYNLNNVLQFKVAGGVGNTLRIFDLTIDFSASP